MNRFLMGMLTTLVVGVVVGAVLVYSGTFDVSADTPHSSLVFRVLESAREQSIGRRIRDIAVPADLGDTDRVRRGAGNYAAMCVSCHLAPGKADSEIRMGLYPQPPDLSRADSKSPEGAVRQFWIIKHGIKASAMPAWSRGGIEDMAIWDMVAFLKKMPTLSAKEYVALVESSDGHSHGGLAGEGAMHAPVVKTKPNVQRGGHDPSDGHTH